MDIEAQRQPDMVQDLQNFGSQGQNLFQPTCMLTEEIQFNLEGNVQAIRSLGILEIWDDKYLLKFNLQSIETAQLTIEYRVTQSIGTSGNTLILFILDPQLTSEDCAQQQQQTSISDQLIALIKKQAKGQFFLRGTATLSITFKSRENKDKAYELMGLYVGEDDEGASDYENDEDMGEMIGPDDIDEFGNIIVKDLQNEEDEEDDEGQSMEDESEEQK